jgi:catechol 2,3-dioxygenase-like lactoylglutathione lyase family enzyme
MRRKNTLLVIGILIAMLIVFNVLQSCAQSSSSIDQKRKIMYEDVYPVFITKDLKASQHFYTKWFGMSPVFESTFFVFLVTPGDRPRSLGLLSENHPSSPPSSPAMNSQAGAYLTLQVADAREFFMQMKSEGLKISYELRDEPWGQRRFGVIDPSGMYIDVVQQIEPQAGFWDKYLVKP